MHIDLVSSPLIHYSQLQWDCHRSSLRKKSTLNHREVLSYITLSYSFSVLLCLLQAAAHSVNTFSAVVAIVDLHRMSHVNRKAYCPHQILYLQYVEACKSLRGPVPVVQANYKRQTNKLWIRCFKLIGWLYCSVLHCSIVAQLRGSDFWAISRPQGEIRKQFQDTLCVDISGTYCSDVLFYWATAVGKLTETVKSKCLSNSLGQSHFYLCVK